MRSVVRAAVALELRLDPVGGRPVAVGALAPVAELRQPLDGGLVFLQVEPADQRADGVVRRRRLGRRRPPAPGRQQAGPASTRCCRSRRTRRGHTRSRRFARASQPSRERQSSVSSNAAGYYIRRLSSPRRRGQEMLAAHWSLKLTDMLIRIGIGVPFSTTGVNSHWLTASSAAWSRSGTDFTTRAH